MFADVGHGRRRYHRVPLLDSVQELLDQVCNHTNQPQPDDATRIKLSLLSEEDALYVLGEIYNTKTPIRTLNGFICFMIKKLESTDEASRTVSTFLRRSPSASSVTSPQVVEQLGGCGLGTCRLHCPSASPATPQGESVHGSPVLNQGPSSPGTSQIRLWHQPQGEPPKTSPVTLPSPYQILMAPSTSAAQNHPCKLYKSFQGLTLHTPVLDHPGDHGQEHLEALGELEFRKQFLILSYAGRKKLKDVIGADDITSWKHLPMFKFETKVWDVLGEKTDGKADRRLFPDWDSGRTHLYYCYVLVDGSYTFKGPFLNKTRTVLQKQVGDDNILIVKFTKGNSNIPSDDNYSTYSRVIREGILVGLRRYKLFVFKDGHEGKKKMEIKDPTSSPVKCYFVRVDSDAAIDRDKDYILSDKTTQEGRCLFAHVHTATSVTNYMARLSLILSKTLSLELDWSVVNVKFIKEVFCRDEDGKVISVNGKARIHTDGTGFISEDLALLCPEIVRKANYSTEEHIEGLDCPDDELDENVLERKQPYSRTRELPLLMQFRLFYKGYAIKGTFLVNKLLPPKTIQIRPSMTKIYSDPFMPDGQSVNSLEIVGTSKLMKKSFLSRNLISILYYGGVPKEYFMELLVTALEETRSVFSNKSAAFRFALRYGEIDDNSNVAKMISCGIPLEESYIQFRLSVLEKAEKTSLRRGKIFIPESYYVMGTADPTGKLERDEVCIILDKGPLSGDVLVYRNPGVHFGDIHVLKATYVKELENFVGNAKYGIFFSCKGPRSVADEMGGGDFDGDLYWISRNPQLLESFTPSEPWIETPPTIKGDGERPSELLNDHLEEALIKLFLKTRFEPSYAMSEAADNWMAQMDKFLSLGDRSIGEKAELKAKILRLVDLYYDALDAPKKGSKVVVPKELKVTEFPHFMEKDPKTFKSYISTSILGLLYDKVNEYQREDRSPKEIRKIPLFEVDVPENCLTKWKKLYHDYRLEMTSALGANNEQGNDQAAISVIKKYKEILYEAEEFEGSGRHRQQIYNEALAIYHICYDYAITVKTAKGVGDVGKCGFTWKVAGDALCRLHEDLSLKPGEKGIRFVPSVLKEIL